MPPSSLRFVLRAPKCPPMATPTHPRGPLATRGDARYSLRLVATASALAPIEAFWWGLLRLPSLNLFGGGVLPCRGRFVVSLAFFRLSMQFASYGRVALVGLLRLVCCQARHSPPALWSGESGSGLGPHFLSAPALSLRPGVQGVSPRPQPGEVCRPAPRVECPPLVDLLRGLVPPAPPSPGAIGSPAPEEPLARPPPLAGG